MPCGGAYIGGGPLIGAGPRIGIPGAPIPTPLPGPAKPAGACCISGATYIDLAIGYALPIPPIVAASPTLLPAYAGGASALIVTMFSPLNSTSPRALFISRSFSSGFLGLTFLNSSVSANTQFKCLSKAMKVPTKVLES